MAEILLLEDEESVNRGIEFTLKKEGYEVENAGTIREAWELFQKQEPKLMICDVNLPDGSSLDLIRRIRKTSLVHVICLTAMDTEIDQVMGYEAGADDYITKPFKMPILHRRIQAALRKSGKTADRAVYDDGYLKIDFDKMTAVKGEESLSMTPTEYRILRLLIANADRVMTKGLLLEKIWDQGGSFVDEHTVAVNINRLRKKIETPVRSYIKTLYGMGYQWKGGK